MRKTQLSVSLSVFSASAFILAACAGGASGESATSEDQATNDAPRELNALVWCDHTDPALLEPFEEANNVTVNVRDYEGTGVGLGILDQSQPGDWDVFVVDSVDVPRVAEDGVLAPLNKEDFDFDAFFEEVQLPEIHELDGTLYAVPEKFGYNTVAFNGASVDAEKMRDLSFLWDPELAGKIAIYDYYIPVMEFVGLELGIEPQDITVDDLPAIEARLVELKEQSAQVGDVVSTQTALATGEVDVIVGGGEFSTSVLNAENPDLDWILPNQGGIRWQQAIGVIADSEKQELATKFVQYVVSAEGQAALATSSCYWGMPANKNAALSEEQKDLLRWDEQAEFIANSYPYYIPDTELDSAMLDVWTRVVVG
jgi:spermidine/putrescine transport system substrate-binding protein